ncbi:helix-turn-helix domain-containing protein [Kineosporia succinea]|uniref:Transcriptional regulator with XRE-family HTH domain n=1 Tax=Kineosporia succinea TaxID=84632 RepID=A0ABT9P5Q7_9ACTN|nr:helix-turn-helix transcriptional regulator [Kineosporia succinea]MDP9828026.1 transcriptional regulator with XRE-family HTH domain [Kineosporia succinea]
MKATTKHVSLAQRQLAKLLKEAREHAELTQEDVAGLIGMHEMTISRIENAHTSVKTGQVLEMARIYKLSDSEADDLLALARGAKDPGWADRYRDAIPSPVSMLADLEAATTGLLDYAPEILPALLMTPAYAEHLINLDSRASAETRRQRLSFRLERQQRIFARQDRPTLRFVLHEAVLRARLSSPQVMSEQLAHLSRLSRQKGIEIRVWAYSCGLHPWMTGAFTVLQSDGRYPHVVYTESALEGRYWDIPSQVEEYARLFGVIRRKAIPLKEIQE